jgi:hypothetical protein
MIKTQVLSALRHVLQPLVRVLLRNGVVWNQFAELGKEVFVQVAREDYGLQGRPTNTARVALITGLSRREVMRVKSVLLGESGPATPMPGRISQILTAWHVDPQFLGADGKPALLPASGEGPTMATLLRNHAGDSPHGAVLKELEELRLVERSAQGFRVLARDYIRSAADPDLLRQAGVALHDHAATVAYNVDANRSGPARFERMATHRTFPRRHLPEFEAFLEAEGRAFLERVDSWLAARARDGGEPARAVDKPEPSARVGVGLYRIHEEERRRRP